MRSAAPPNINAVAATAKYHSPPFGRGGPVIRAIGLTPDSLRRDSSGPRRPTAGINGVRNVLICFRWIRLLAKAEGIEPTVGADEEAVGGGDQCLEMAQPGERRAGEQSFAGIAAEAMQPVVAFGAEHPDDRIGA